MFRIKIPEVIFNTYEYTVATKSSGDAFDNLKSLRQLKSLKATIDWNAFASQLKRIKEDELASQLGQYLIQTKTDISFMKSSARDRLDQIKELALNFTKLPDFQLC